MNDQRGFRFLVGLAVLWLLWRYYARGIFFATVECCTGQDICFGGPEVQSYGGPGAIVVAAIIEFVITVGWVTTLVISGIWDGLVIFGGFIGDGFGAAHTYIKGAQAESVPEASQPTANVVQSTGDPEKDAITLLSQQVVYLAGELKAMKEAKA